MANYVDGIVAAYRRMARKSGKVWREHGALEYRECVAVMQDPRLAKMMKSMPFDGKRMFWGGFKPIVSL
jgi:uncharacterized protein YbaA (DUF1428 family)